MSLMSDSKQSYLRITPFDGKDFIVWKHRILTYLEQQGLLNVVLTPLASTQVTSTSLSIKAEPTEEAKSTDTTVHTQVSVDQQKKNAYQSIISTITDNQLRLILHVPRNEPKQLWDAILKLHERTTETSKSHLRMVLHNSRMNESEAFDQYVTRINTVLLKLNDVGESASNAERMFVLLQGLPQLTQHLYKPFVSIILLIMIWLVRTYAMRKKHRICLQISQ